MAIFVKTNGDGDILAFFDTDLVGKPPRGAVEISEADWIECISNQGRRRIVDGAVVEYTPPVPEVVATKPPTKSELKAQLDALSEKIAAL